MWNAISLRDRADARKLLEAWEMIGLLHACLVARFVGKCGVAASWRCQIAPAAREWTQHTKVSPTPDRSASSRGLKIPTDCFPRDMAPAGPIMSATAAHDANDVCNTLSSCTGTTRSRDD